MAKGVFRGFVTGMIVSGLGIGAMSLMYPLRDGPAPKTGAVEVPAGSDFEGKREDTQPTLPGSEAAPKPAEAPKIELPSSDAGNPVNDDATQPASKPETGEPEGTLTPPADAAPPAETGRDDTAPSPVTEVDQPAAPAGDDARISTDPAQPAAPEAPEEKAFPEQDNAADVSPGAEEGAPPVPPQRAEPLPSVTDEEPEAERPRIGTPAGSLTEKDEPAQVVTEDVTPPIRANAVAFENFEAKPLMSVILLDDGAGSVGAEALAAFPYPLTFAVDAFAPDAPDRMARYRAAGFEVMALLDMPQGATPADAETSLRGALNKLPEAVAVMEGDATGLQEAKPVSDQLAAILSETGHGLVLFPKGLNTAQKLAAKEGVPSATVFRDFDGKEQDAQVIRRFLDQAAFKARQEENGVIMLGRMRPDTISALLLWGLQDRASSVALAPISALLLAQKP